MINYTLRPSSVFSDLSVYKIGISSTQVSIPLQRFPCALWESLYLIKPNIQPTNLKVQLANCSFSSGINLIQVCADQPILRLENPDHSY